jgi:MFS family permease
MPEDTHFSGQRVSLLQWLILATLTLTSTLYAMSITIANIALPQLQGALAATQDQIAWTVTFNIVGTAIVTPMTGWLTTRSKAFNVNSCFWVRHFIYYVRTGDNIN